MEALRLDDVAYVRFASVYKNFREAKDFEELLGELRTTVTATSISRATTIRRAGPDPARPRPRPKTSAKANHLR